MNRGDLIATVKGYLNRPDLADAVVASWCPIVEGQLNRALRTHPRTITQATYPLVIGDSSFVIPTDTLQVLTLRTATDTWTQYPVDARAKAEDEGTTYILIGDTVTLFPTLTEDLTFYLDYHAALTPLTDDAHTNWVSSYFGDVYLYGLLKEAAMYLKDDQRFATWGQEFGKRTLDLIQQGWDQNWATSPQVRTL